ARDDVGLLHTRERISGDEGGNAEDVDAVSRLRQAGGNPGFVRDFQGERAQPRGHLPGQRVLTFVGGDLAGQDLFVLVHRSNSDLTDERLRVRVLDVAFDKRGSRDRLSAEHIRGYLVAGVDV